MNILIRVKQLYIVDVTLVLNTCYIEFIKPVEENVRLNEFTKFNNTGA